MHTKRDYLVNEGYKVTGVHAYKEGLSSVYIEKHSFFQVIMSHATHLYYDHAYEPDPSEWGAYWATRYTDTRKVFGFIPDDLYANIDTDIHGNVISRETICNKEGECPPLEHKENIIGEYFFINQYVLFRSDRKIYVTSTVLLPKFSMLYH